MTEVSTEGTRLNDLQLLRKLKGCRSRLKSESDPREVCARIKAVNFIELDLEITTREIPGAGHQYTMWVESPTSRLTFAVETRNWDGKTLRCIVTSNLQRQPAYESARVEVHDMWIGLDAGFGWEDVRVLDVSREGIAVLTPEATRPGDTLHLRVKYQGMELEMSASARYCRDLPTMPGFRRVGMELHSRSRGDQAKWLSLYERVVNAA